jgi:hypothetical protein
MITYEQKLHDWEILSRAHAERTRVRVLNGGPELDPMDPPPTLPAPPPEPEIEP